MDLDSLYQEIILDHYRTPHHAGLREPFEAEVHHVNPTCGDEITLRVQSTAGVTDVSYDAEGCSISQASASVMDDLVIGSRWTRPGEPRGFVELMQGRGQVEADEESSRTPSRSRASRSSRRASNARCLAGWRSRTPRLVDE